MSTEFKDYYEILGVPEDAEPDAIKKAYRKLARRYHPDINKEADAERRFTDVSEAYEVLGKADKRKEYDALRKRGWHGGDRWDLPPEWAAGADGGGGFASGGGEAFSDFFESLFGGAGGGANMGGMGGMGGFTRGAQAGPRRGRDRHARLAVALEESFSGARKTIQLDQPVRDAQGRITARTRTLGVTIPKGITEGEHIRLRGQGDPGAGGEAGDLYLEVGLIPHPYFVPEGRDIHLALPVAPWEAALGAEITVPTLGGTARLRIPAGSDNGARLRLRDQGLPGDPPGNQIVELRIAMPPAPDAESQEHWQALAAASGFDPRARWKGRR